MVIPAGPSRTGPNAGSAGAATTPSASVPISAPAAAANLRAAASPGHGRGVTKKPTAQPMTRPPKWPQLSTPADPSPAANSASSHGTIRSPKYERNDPRTPRRQPKEAAAPSRPKAMPLAPSEMESDPTADARMVPSDVKMSIAR